MNIWAFVPARGGSKSIKLKNMAILGGRPLIDYGVLASIESGIFERIICSTENDIISKRAIDLGIEVDPRDKSLAGDEITTKEVLIDFLKRQKKPPKYIFIIEPTSPFLRTKDIKQIKEKLIKNNYANTAQTICKPSHTNHAWNQRSFKNGIVKFIFEKRKKIHRKQDKPKLYIFGNLIACKVEYILKGGDVFGEPSIGVEIDWPYNINIDSKNDLELAEILYNSGIIKLSHI